MFWKKNIFPKKAPHRMFLYKEGVGRVFEKGETIPAGYSDKLPKVKK